MNSPPARAEADLRPALLALTVTTGLIDGVSYLGLGHVFTANMTGNVVLLGFGIAGAGGLPVMAPIVSLAAFLAGAGAGGRIAARLGQRRLRLFATGVTAETVVLGAAAAVVAAAAVRAGSAAGYVAIALLGIAMGLRNATVRKLAVPDLTSTVLTLTLTALAAELARGSRLATAIRAGAVLAMAAGAAIGALTVRDGLVAPLAIAAGVDALAVAWTLAPGRRR